MKKILACFLAVIMAFAVAVPVAAAAEETTATIYLEGYGSWLFDENGKQIFPVSLDLVGGITAVFDEMTVEELQQGIIDRMAKNGPVTDQMKRDVYGNNHHGSLVNWIKSFR